jgi:hypothetical protein
MGQPVTGLTASEAIAQAGSGAGDSIAQGQTVSAPMRVGSIPVVFFLFFFLLQAIDLQLASS